MGLWILEFLAFCSPCFSFLDLFFGGIKFFSQVLVLPWYCTWLSSVPIVIAMLSFLNPNTEPSIPQFALLKPCWGHWVLPLSRSSICSKNRWSFDGCTAWVVFFPCCYASFARKPQSYYCMEFGFFFYGSLPCVLCRICALDHLLPQKIIVFFVIGICVVASFILFHGFPIMSHQIGNTQWWVNRVECVDFESNLLSRPKILTSFDAVFNLGAKRLFCCNSNLWMYMFKDCWVVLPPFSLGL